MKRLRLLLLFCWFCMVAFSVYGQQEKYNEAMKAYEQKDYRSGAALLDPFIKNKGESLSSMELYNSACIYSMAGKKDAAFRLLDILATKYFMSNAQRLETDTDLAGLRGSARWQQLIAKVDANLKTEPARNASTVRAALSRAKAILTADNGQLWGTALWSDDVLVLDPKNRAYGVQPFKGAVFRDSLWSQDLPERTLNQSNAPQDFGGKRYAIVMTSYLLDSSATLIHELFHLAQEKQVLLNGNPVNYLDGWQGREYLRLEYEALKSGLQLARTGAPKTSVAQALSDAVCFRKLRRALAPEALDAETDIESSEGLANYTGFKLSDHRDKYALAIKEINGRESAPTYTRTFPYATGPAYGFLFDYLGINWRDGIGMHYNFGGIFEKRYLQDVVATDSVAFRAAAERHGYGRIHDEEMARKALFERCTAWFTKTLVEAPVLRATVVTDTYSRSFDMNGTFVLADKGMVYTTLRGTDLKGQNFGSFQTTNTGDTDHPAGVLGSFNGRQFTFPLPVKIEGNKITGPNYELILNPGWVLQKAGNKGDLEIVRK
ncbi:TPR end-of-group domain-containing protein [Mucilaginibacter litoreus]|uniref:TPR end-of-group domain-containing protein n=1 Tax=Mucilaginibacter litoreus TaxID=1048221 RepID=A0ABW3AWP1_9SPHI